MAQTNAAVQPPTNDHTDNWSVWRGRVHNALMICNELYGQRIILRNELADTGFDMTRVRYYDEHPDECNKLTPEIRAYLIRIHNVGIVIERHAMGAEVLSDAIKDATLLHEDKMMMEAGGVAGAEGNTQEGEEGEGEYCDCGGYHEDQSNNANGNDESEDEDSFVNRW